MAFNFSGITKSIQNFVSRPSSSGQSGSVFDLLDPSKARLGIANLFKGGGSTPGNRNLNIGFANSQGAANSSESDWRVRLSLADAASILYKDPTQTTNSIMEPLLSTNGMIFPYTPQISVSHLANYQSQGLTHSNYAQHFYTNSEVSEISISGEFTVQNADEGRYLIAVIYFLRSCTKMFFGKDAEAGNPPPIIFLDGYGSHYFPHVPVVVSNFTHTMGSDVDYIEIPVKTTKLEEVEQKPDVNNYGSVQNAEYVPELLRSGAGTTTKAERATTKLAFNTLTTKTRVPTTSTVSVTLKPVYSRTNIHENFTLGDFSKGRLLGTKDRGGFL